MLCIPPGSPIQIKKNKHTVQQTQLHISLWRRGPVRNTGLGRVAKQCTQSQVQESKMSLRIHCSCLLRITFDLTCSITKAASDDKSVTEMAV